MLRLLLLSVQQPNRPQEAGTTKAPRLVRKGSGEGTQWGQKMNGCHKEDPVPCFLDVAAEVDCLGHLVDLRTWMKPLTQPA